MTTAADSMTPLFCGRPLAAPAAWRARVGAFAVDVLLGLGVIATLTVAACSVIRGGWLWWSYSITAATVLLATTGNRLLVPALCGWTLGRALFGIRVVDCYGAAPGPWRLLARDTVHLVDTLALCMGWLWPLWDSQRRTFADIALRTQAVAATVTPSRIGHRGAAAVSTVAALAVVAVVAATLGYVNVYRHDFALARAREQLAVQGPTIVTDLLSYAAATLAADFDRARTLVTDAYLPRLETEQHAVQRGPIVDNEVWAVNAAVLSVSEGTGAMLVLLQGQRGQGPTQRTITATVTADFERLGAGPWKVANLAVLAKPHPSEASR